MSTVHLDIQDAIATLRLANPPMNALDAATQAALGRACDDLARRSDVRAVVVHGGPKVFAAGADVKQMAAEHPGDLAARSAALQNDLGALARLPQPTVAAITGFALGGGLEVALGCDFRVCGAGARLGLPEILLGLIPGGGGTQRLARVIGAARAKDLVFTGRMVGAQEALAIGLVDEVVDDGDVLAAATARVAKFTTGPTLALRAAKKAIDAGLDGSLDAGLELERALFCAVFGTEDAQAGMTSFVTEGPGKARFNGR